MSSELSNTNSSNNTSSNAELSSNESTIECIYANPKTDIKPLEFVTNQFEFFINNARMIMNALCEDEQIPNTDKYLLVAQGNFVSEKVQNTFKTKFMFNKNDDTLSLISVDDYPKGMCKFESKDAMINYYQSHSKSVMEHYKQDVTKKFSPKYEAFFYFDNQEIKSLYLVYIGQSKSRNEVLDYLEKFIKVNEQEEMIGYEEDFVYALYPVHLYRHYPNYQGYTKIHEYLNEIVETCKEGASMLPEEVCLCTFDVVKRELSYNPISEKIGFVTEPSNYNPVNTLLYFLCKVTNSTTYNPKFEEITQDVKFLKLKDKIYFMRLNPIENFKDIISQVQPKQTTVPIPKNNHKGKVYRQKYTYSHVKPMTIAPEDLPDHLEALAEKRACNEE